jgi:hypothetical protein
MSNLYENPQEKHLTACGASESMMLDMLARWYDNKHQMAFRVKIGNWEIETDTSQEMLDLLRAIGLNGIQDQVVRKENNPISWTAAGVTRLLEMVEQSPSQIKLLGTLGCATEALLKDDLAKQFGSAQQLGGVLAGIAKNAKKIGSPPIFTVKKLQLNGNRTCRYHIDPEFQHLFVELMERGSKEAGADSTLSVTLTLDDVIAAAAGAELAGPSSISFPCPIHKIARVTATGKPDGSAEMECEGGCSHVALIAALGLNRTPEKQNAPLDKAKRK